MNKAVLSLRAPGSAHCCEEGPRGKEGSESHWRAERWAAEGDQRRLVTVRIPLKHKTAKVDEMVPAEWSGGSGARTYLNAVARRRWASTVTLFPSLQELKQVIIFTRAAPGDIILLRAKFPTRQTCFDLHGWSFLWPSLQTGSNYLRRKSDLPGFLLRL